MAPTLSGQADGGVLELHSTAEAWLDVEIAMQAQHCPRQAGRSEARQAADISSVSPAHGAPARATLRGQHKLQLHDEDPGVGCLRMDAVGADLESSPLIPDPYCPGTNGYKGSKNNYLHPFYMAKPSPVVFWRGSTTGSKNITPDNLECNLRYKLCRHSLTSISPGCAFQSGRSVP